jgi:hypothetical protein
VLAFVVAPLAVPPIWGFCRIVVGVLDVPDATVLAVVLAPALWLGAVVVIAALAWTRWQRRGLAKGLLMALLVFGALGGATAFAMAAAMGSGIRG